MTARGATRCAPAPALPGPQVRPEPIPTRLSDGLGEVAPTPGSVAESAVRPVGVQSARQSESLHMQASDARAYAGQVAAARPPRRCGPRSVSALAKVHEHERAGRTASRYSSR